MNLNLGDIVEMKKEHPCGNKLFKINRVGMDIKIYCTKCGREVMLPRSKVEKNIKRIISSGED